MKLTPKQQADFLRKEGWKPTFKGSFYWTDPARPKSKWEGIAHIDIAYTIASSRKSARDTKRLKAAGFLFFRFFGGSYYRIPGDSRMYSKSEALKLLEEASHVHADR